MNSWTRLGLLAAGLGVVAGCASSGSASPEVASLGPPATSAVHTSTDADAAFADYQSCLARLGVDPELFLLDPGAGSALPPSVAASIDTECTPILDSMVADIEFSPDERAAISDAELEFARCMRDQGVEWPDPGSIAAEDLQLDPTLDPSIVDAAFEECEPLLAAIFDTAGSGAAQ